jgi:hypothetical protein
MLAKAVKRPLWGDAATPPLFLDICRSHSFYRYPRFGRERHDLAHLMSRATMERLFGALPDDIRLAYESMSPDNRAEAGLLLLTPADTRGPDYPCELDIRGFGQLASHLVSSHGVDTIIIKPHPLNSAPWIARVADAVRAGIPKTNVVAISQHSAVPIEITVNAMTVVPMTSLFPRFARRSQAPSTNGSRGCCPAARPPCRTPAVDHRE